MLCAGTPTAELTLGDVARKLAGVVGTARLFCLRLRFAYALAVSTHA
jgi:hypothetical protein